MAEQIPKSLNRFAFELKSTSPGPDTGDLQPLKDMLKNTRIVGLGESTHGTREFFTLKHRLTRFLVEEMGFRTFTIEAGTLPCMNIDEYAFMGKGNRAAALASQGYWTWDTEEVTELIEWMRRHNLSCQRGDECRFIGYDIKPVSEACENVRRTLKRCLEGQYAMVDAALSGIERADRTAAEGADGRFTDLALRLWGLAASHEKTIVHAVGRKGFELLCVSCRTLYQYAFGMLEGGQALSGRDRGMAENISHILNRLAQDSKIVVWAHNAHIAVDESWRNMGWRLRREFGDLYFPFALTFTRGAFQSRRIADGDVECALPFGALEEFDAGEPRAGFWEKDLAQIRRGDYYLDLKSARAQDAAVLTWGLREKQSFGAGGGYLPIPENAPEGELFFSKYRLAAYFDGVFHIENTTRARPTPTGMRKAEDVSR